MPVRTKIEISPALVRRISGLDDLARLFFPDNKNHQRAFIAIWLEIKYAEDQFLSSTVEFLPVYDVSSRTIEIVRAKLKRLGLIKRLSHFNPAYGNCSGWVFSSRFRGALTQLSAALVSACDPGVHQIDEKKDRGSLHFI